VNNNKKKKKKTQSYDINDYFSGSSKDKNTRRNIQSYDNYSNNYSYSNKNRREKENLQRYIKQDIKPYDLNTIKIDEEVVEKVKEKDNIGSELITPVVEKKASIKTLLKVNTNCNNLKSDSRTNSRSLVSPHHDLGNAKTEYIKQLSGKLNLTNEYTPKKYSYDGSTGTPVKSVLSGKKTNMFTFDKVDENKEDDSTTTEIVEEINVKEDIKEIINETSQENVNQVNNDLIEHSTSSARCLIF
jgi:hypothetical protein